MLPLYTPETHNGKLRCDCGIACDSPGKHPRTQNGLKNASTDESQIRQWWEMWPEANIGILTGSRSGAVVDVDPRHGGNDSFDDLLSDHGVDWTDTPTVATGSDGRHFWVQHDPSVIKNATALWPGIDIKDQGGYVVAPPSLHMSGRRYSWKVSPNDCPLQPQPAWLNAKRSERTAKGRQRGRAAACGCGTVASYWACTNLNARHGCGPICDEQARFR